MSALGFSKGRGTIFRGPNSRDYNILGSILGSPYLRGKNTSHSKFRVGTSTHLSIDFEGEGFPNSPGRTWRQALFRVLRVAWAHGTSTFRLLKDVDLFLSLCILELEIESAWQLFFNIGWSKTRTAIHWRVSFAARINILQMLCDLSCNVLYCVHSWTNHSEKVELPECHYHARPSIQNRSPSP